METNRKQARRLFRKGTPLFRACSGLGLLLLIVLFSCKEPQKTSLQAASGLQLDTLFDQWSYLRFSDAALPGQFFFFTIPETFTASWPNDRGRGLIRIVHQPWVLSPQEASMTASDSNYQYAIHIKYGAADSIKWIDWQLRFTNMRKDTILDLSAFNCLNLNQAPDFVDTLLERTWVAGKTDSVLLRDLQKRRGGNRRNMQFYPVHGGIRDLSASQWIKHWDVISPDTLSGTAILLHSRSGKWTIRNCVSGRLAYFFANTESTHGCIHAAPLIAATLLPGQTANASGRIELIRTSGK